MSDQHEIDALKKRIAELEKLDAQRKQAEVELRLHSEMMKNMAEGAYLVGGDDGIIKYCNPRFEKMFGYGPGEMVGKHVSIVNAPTEKDPRQTAKEITAALNKTGEWRGEVHNIRKDGTTFWCWANCSVFQHPAYGRVVISVHSDITERKKAEEVLRLSRAHAKLLSRVIATILMADDPLATVETVCNEVREFLHCAVFFSFLLDPQTRRLRFNTCGGVEPRIAKMVEGLELSDSLCGTAARDNCRVLAENLTAVFDSRSEVVRSLGVRAYCAHPLFGPGNKAFGTLSFGATDRDFFAKEDIELMKTVADYIAIAMLRKQAQETLRESEERYKGLVENVDLGVTVMDTDYSIISANDAMGKMLDRDAQSFIGKKCFNEYERRKEICPHCPGLKAMQDKKSHSVETSGIRGDGSIFFVRNHAFPIMKSDGTIKGFMEVVEDISERKKSEEALLRFKVLFELSRDAIMTLEPPSWKFTSGNPATVKMFGARDEAEFISKGPWELSPEFQPDGTPSSEKAQKMIQKAMDTGSNFFEWTHKRLNGQEYPATVLLTKIEIEKGKPFLQATVRDISKEKQAEESILKAGKEWQNTFDSISDIIFILDKDNTIRRVNKIFLDAFGLKREDVVGKKCYELIHKSDKPWAACPHVKTLQDSKPHTEEVDDPVLGIPLLVSTSPIFNEKGECVGTVHIAKNISELKKARQELELKLRDLERFQKVTMGRENRVIELKEEVKRLRAELEK